jgi:tetratricopeptide (TPR) repeat protein
MNHSIFGLNDDFVNGNQQFQAKNYEKAIEAYEIHLAKSNHSKFEACHNLGNAYYRVDNYAKAILNYERALLIEPNNERLQHNLDVVNQKIEDQFAKAESFFLVKWWTNWRNLFSVLNWSIFAILMSFGGAIGLRFLLIGENFKAQRNGLLLGFIALIFMILFSLTAWQRSVVMKKPKTAILINKEIDLKTAADKESPTIFILHSGTKIRLIDELGDWRKVRLPNGDLGWLEKGSFESI